MIVGIGIGIPFQSKTKRTMKDSFNRADNATILGNLDTGQTWTAAVGTWGIRSNQAYSATDASGNLVWVDAATTVFTASLDETGQYNSQFRYASLVVHFVDANNFFYVRLDSNTAEIVKMESGSNTVVASAPFPVTNGSTHNLKVVANDGSLDYYVDSVFKTTYTMTAPQRTLYLASTKVGMRLSKSGTPTFNCDIDNFTIIK